MLDINKIVKDMTNGIKACAREADEASTCFGYLAKNINYNGKEVNVALVYTYRKGYNDILNISDDEIVIKLAHQPSNSVMQCDYDIDWQYPDCANNYTEIGIPVDFILNDKVPNQTAIDKRIAAGIIWCLSWAPEYNIEINTCE